MLIAAGPTVETGALGSLDLDGGQLTDNPS